MKRIAVIPVSEEGRQLAATLSKQLAGDIISRADTGQRWHDFDGFVFIGAMGICVRTIAPYIKDKHEDPAVVCIDSFGRNAISVLSGHIGGANDLAREVAALTGAREVITTQSDNAGLWALDTLAERFGWQLADSQHMNQCIFAFVNRQPTALLIEARDEGTDYLEQTKPEHVTIISSIDEMDERYKLLIAVSPFALTSSSLTLQYVPRIATIGFGLAHQATPVEAIYNEMFQALNERRINVRSIKEWCTIDVKADEPFVRYLREQGESVRFFTAEELAAIDVPNPSDTVEKHVGTPSVCEAAAILGSNHGQLVIPKVKGKNWTASIAINLPFEGRFGGMEWSESLPFGKRLEGWGAQKASPLERDLEGWGGQKASPLKEDLEGWSGQKASPLERDWRDGVPRKPPLWKEIWRDGVVRKPPLRGEVWRGLLSKS